MAVTPMANMINPQVMGDMINAKIEALLKITPYAKVDTTLQGVPGDTKTVPSWNYIGDAADVAEGAEVGLTEMTANTTTFTIKKAMKAVGLTQEAINSGYGDPVGQAEQQLAKSIAGKVDGDVLNAAFTSTNIADETAGIIGYKPVVRAVGRFGDEEDNIDKVMFIHPEQETQLLQDDSFISADKFQAGVAVNGSIGKIAGCWVKKSKKVPKVDAVEAVTAVAGVYSITLTTKATANDRIKINNVEIVAGSSDWDLTTDSVTGNAAALATALNASTDASVSGFTWSSAAGKLTATEDTGKEGTLGIFTAVITKGVSGTLAATGGVVTDTAGVKKVDAVPALYKCPIIKLEPDSAETEYTETELPALTIFLKKDTQTDADWKPRTQTHEITTAKYYGVALTNAAKVVIAKFAQTAQA